MLNDDKNIGKYYKIKTSKQGHPKIKFEKHLPIANFYECFLIGKLHYIYNDKWEMGELMTFHNVSYPLMKYDNSNIIWSIHLSDIISFQEITEQEYEENKNEFRNISKTYKQLLKK